MVDVQSLSHAEHECDGPHGLMEQEERYLELLPRVERYGTYASDLFLQTDNQGFLLFEAK